MNIRRSNNRRSCGWPPELFSFSSKNIAGREAEGCDVNFREVPSKRARLRRASKLRVFHRVLRCAHDQVQRSFDEKTRGSEFINDIGVSQSCPNAKIVDPINARYADAFVFDLTLQIYHADMFLILSLLYITHIISRTLPSRDSRHDVMNQI